MTSRLSNLKRVSLLIITMTKSQDLMKRTVSLDIIWNFSMNTHEILIFHFLNSTFLYEYHSFYEKRPDSTFGNCYTHAVTCTDLRLKKGNRTEFCRRLVLFALFAFLSLIKRSKIDDFPSFCT